jgi:hypothetical protein
MPDRTIVTIGGSSGGLHAMQKLVAALPPHPGTAIFLVLHSAPDSSRLALSFPTKFAWIGFTSAYAAVPDRMTR